MHLTHALSSRMGTGSNQMCARALGFPFIVALESPWRRGRNGTGCSSGQPDNAWVRVKRALAFQIAGLREEALAEVEAALVLDPNDPEARELKGTAYKSHRGTTRRRKTFVVYRSQTESGEQVSGPPGVCFMAPPVSDTRHPICRSHDQMSGISNGYTAAIIDAIPRYREPGARGEPGKISYV